MSASQEVLRGWAECPPKMAWDLWGLTLDTFQEEALLAYGKCPRLAMKSAKGPGKTFTLAMIGWNFLLTRAHPYIGATSISKDNLQANLWTELARWRTQSKLLDLLFEQNAGRIYYRQHPETWKLEARTWAKDADPQQVGAALAGVHAKNVMWLGDECGDYPDGILPVMEAIFSGNPIEAHVVLAGNPIKLSGPLYRACVTARALWKIIEITGDPDDPKRSSRISIEHARQMIAQYGRDNPWVMVDILGQFPPAAFNALIGPSEVTAAMNRFWREHEIGRAPRILGVDVAGEGDDSSVIARRHGIQMFPFKQYRNIDSTQGAGIVAREWQEFGPDGADACFLDNTGGFGAGWGDQLQNLGRAPIRVGFSNQAHQPERYYNKRAEMAFDFVEWIKRGGALPDCPQLLAALTQTTYAFKGDRLILEPKASVKAKIGYSPDHMDAGMLTHAEPVLPRQRALHRPQAMADIDPLRDFADSVGRSNAGSVGMKSDWEGY